MTRTFRRILIGELVIAVFVIIVIASGMNRQSATPTPTPSPTPSPSLTQESSFVTGCEGLISPRTISTTWSQAPQLDFKDNRKYWNLETNCGQVVIEAFKDKAPIGVNSLRFLTDNKYFDESPCHRLTIKSFYVIQCGDPKGNGTGGAGYQIMEENLPENVASNYPEGTVALAKTAQPNTSGAQFFIVYKDTTLPPQYSVVGKVIRGMDIIKAVAAAGTLGNVPDGTLKQSFGIKSAEFLAKKPATS